MKKFVNPVKFTAAAIVFAFFFLYGIMFLFQHKWLDCAVFFVLAAVFAYVLFIYGSCIIVTREEVCLRFLTFRRRSFRWSQVSEVGVVGLNLFKKKESRKSGTKYIYFSPVRMTEDERFKMALAWPPKEKIYAVYSEELFLRIQSLWNEKVALYNADDLDI